MSRSRFLKLALTAETLRKYAGSRSFVRGEDYHESGCVENLRQNGDRITAIVHGTEDYDVTLIAQADSLHYSCSCPVGDERAFCKHCVAVGMTWLDLDGEGGAETDDAIRSYLEGLGKGDLVEMLLEHAGLDSNLYQKLAIKVAAARDGADFEKVIDRAMKSRTFVDYYKMRNYARSATEIIDRIEAMLGEGSAERVVALSEHALKAAEHTLDECDDSDGFMSQVLGRLQDIHLEACAMCLPDPVSLAKHLFDWELRSDWDVFYGAANTYRDVLGDNGLAEYRRLAQLEWDKVPALKAGKKYDPDSNRLRVTAVMKGVARGIGDLEMLAEIHKRDLTLPDHYLEVAQVYAEMGRTDLAIDWASQGVEAFSERPDRRLGAFLADQYEHSGDEYRAMQVEWEQFGKELSSDGYTRLKVRAERLGQWELWRPRAIGAVRDQISKRLSANTSSYFRADSSELVSIYLGEGDAESAWREACEGGCSAHLMLQLAEAREKLHPLDAARIYKAYVETLVDRANNGAYEEAVSFVKRIRSLAPAEDFAPYLAGLGARHKAKRNFMKLLATLAPVAPDSQMEPIK